MFPQAFLRQLLFSDLFLNILSILFKENTWPSGSRMFLNFIVLFMLLFLSQKHFCCMKILFRAYDFIIKSITRNFIVFKKPRKMTNDFFIHYIFVHTFQWTSSECLTNVTITLFIILWNQLTASAVNCSHKKIRLRCL